jgi:hypothetical protein
MTFLPSKEMALDGPLDGEIRDNLSKSYDASRALIHVINDLLVSILAPQSAMERALRFAICRTSHEPSKVTIFSSRNLLTFPLPSTTLFKFINKRPPVGTSDLKSPRILPVRRRQS